MPEPIQYIVFNEEIDIPLAEILNQTASIATLIATIYNKDKVFQKWFSGSQRTTILKAGSAYLRTLLQRGFYYCYNVKEPGQLAVIALPPMDEECAAYHVNGLKKL